MSRTASPRAPRVSVRTNTIVVPVSRPRYRRGVERCIARRGPMQTLARGAGGGVAVSDQPRLRREVRLDLAQDGVLATCSHDASLLLAVLEHDERGDAQHAVLLRRLRVVVDVELHGLHA